MSDIVERLRHCADNCGDEYLRELSGRAADEIERLRAELLERDAVWLPEKDAEIERLRAELRDARANALEEAARVVGVKLFNNSCTCGFEVAAAIRALKGDGE